MILTGNCLDILRELPSEHVQTCITSPPYWGLRDYGVEGQLGLEKTPDEYVANMVQVFREVRRVLKDDGTLWLNLGDCYAASQYGSGGGWAKGKNKDGTGGNTLERSLFKDPGYNPMLPFKNLVGIPWRVAFALQADGWYLRQDIIWHKPNPMPESVRDRCTKAHEYMFLLSKSPKYYFDNEAIKEPAIGGASGNKGRKQRPTQDTIQRGNQAGSIPWIGEPLRNRRTVWTVTTKPFKGAHFATFPPDLIEPCVLAGSAFGDYVLDPFSGAGTTGLVAQKHGRKYIGIELNPEYTEIAEKRIASMEDCV